MDTQGSELGESKNAGQTPGKARQPTRQAVAQVRGVLAEQVVFSNALDPFLSLRALANYSCVSVRKLRELLDDSAHPLPHYRLGSKILVRRSEFDAWMAVYRQVGQADVERIVDSVMRDLGGA
jgi:excisionase family DNA binding protein